MFPTLISLLLRTGNLTAILCCFIFMSACQQSGQLKPDHASLQVKIFDLSEFSTYQFKGKMSFSDGQDGGSGSVDWQSVNNLVTTRLSAPLSSKNWQINELLSGAELINNGRRAYAESAQSLISDQLGWDVPWLKLKSWVIGKPHNNKAAKLNWLTNEFILHEDGWRIEFSRLKEVADNPVKYLSHKMVARKGDYSIKLIVKQWNW